MPTFEPCFDLPSPWTRCIIHFVGGLTGVGFGPSGAELLVVSHAGRGVISLSTGVLVARDPADIPIAELSETPFQVMGIGALAGRWIPCAGLWGGSLPSVGFGGWRLRSAMLLSPDGESHELPEPDAHVVALGFDPSGRIFLYATGASLSMYYWVG